MRDLETVRAFVEVAKQQSFTRAAVTLRLSKSRVSLMLRALEDHLGVALLQRSTRAVQLTAAGTELLARAERLLQEADELSALFQTPSALQGHVRVDLPITFAKSTIIPRLPEFLAQHPHIELFLSTTDQRVDLVREGFDCVLRIGTLRDSSLVARKVGALEMVNVASPAYLRRYGTPTGLQHLSSHKVVHYGGGAPSFEHQKGEVPMSALVTVNSTDAYQAACLAGLGIIQAPRYGLHGLLASGSLVEVLPRHVCKPMPMSIVFVKRDNQPKRVKVFIDWLAEVVGYALRSVQA